MKFTLKQLVAVVALLSTPVTVLGNKDKPKPAKVGVTTCGPESICSTTVNAIGDEITIDVSKLPVKDLGSITEEKTETVTLPVQEGTQTMYSLTPTTGNAKDKKVFVVFDHLKPRPGTRHFGKTFISVYRRFDEKDAKWIEVGNTQVEPKITDEQKDISVTFKPDGNAVWENPLTQKPEVFHIGASIETLTGMAAKEQPTSKAEAPADATPKEQPAAKTEAPVNMVAPAPTK